MQAIWDFLSDPGNRETLAWLGGGAVVVIGGLWTAWRTLGARPAAPKQPSISAERGGVAIGGDATGAKIDTRGE